MIFVRCATDLMHLYQDADRDACEPMRCREVYHPIDLYLEELAEAFNEGLEKTEEKRRFAKLGTVPEPERRVPIPACVADVYKLDNCDLALALRRLLKEHLDFIRKIGSRDFVRDVGLALGDGKLRRRLACALFVQYIEELQCAREGRTRPLKKRKARTST